MSEMIERVAKASAFARRSRHDQARDAEHYWEYLGRETQEVELTAARAAIEAMREPTEAMLLAFHDGPLGAGDHEMDDKARKWLTEGWQAMLSAALAPAPLAGGGGE